MKISKLGFSNVAIEKSAILPILRFLLPLQRGVLIEEQPMDPAQSRRNILLLGLVSLFSQEYSVVSDFMLALGRQLPMISSRNSIGL